MSLCRASLLSFALLTVALAADGSSYAIERDLWSEVLVADPSHVLIPASKERATSSSTVYFSVGDDGGRLIFGAKLSRLSYIFKNGKLLERVPPDTWYLAEAADAVAGDAQLYALYLPKGTFREQDSVVLFNSQSIAPHTLNATAASAVLVHDSRSYVSQLVLLGLLVFAFQVLVRTVSPGYFIKLFDLRKAIISVEFEEGSGRPMMSREHLLILFATALNIAMLYILIGHSRHMLLLSDRIPFPFEIFGQQVFSEFILAVLGVLAVVVIKYLFSIIISAIVGMPKMADVHFGQFIRIAYVLSAVVADIAFVFLFSVMADSPILLRLLPVLILVTLLLTMLNVVLYIYNWSTVRNNLLFSYLCATEILPVLLLFIYFK